MVSKEDEGKLLDVLVVVVAFVCGAIPVLFAKPSSVQVQIALVVLSFVTIVLSTIAWIRFDRLRSDLVEVGSQQIPKLVPAESLLRSDNPVTVVIWTSPTLGDDWKSAATVFKSACARENANIVEVLVPFESAIGPPPPFLVVAGGNSRRTYAGSLLLCPEGRLMFAAVSVGEGDKANV